MAIPTWWYRAGEGKKGLEALRGGQWAGESQAALRVLIAVALAQPPKVRFQSKASLTELEGLTGLSRPTVLRGIHAAVAAGLLEYAKGGPREASEFALVSPEATSGTPGGWAKLPAPQAARSIPCIPKRGNAGLVALKVYLTLIAARPNNSPEARLTHRTLRAKTGAQPRDIRKAISLLANEGLVHVNHEDKGQFIEDEHSWQPAHRYRISGNLLKPS